MNADHDTRAILPIIRSHERMDFKRCEKKWYWKWRRGLVLRQKRFGALELGTWVHAAMAYWYKPGFERDGDLPDLFRNAALMSIRIAESNNAPESALEKAEELLGLGVEMMTAYQDFYGLDPTLDIIGTEIPLEFTISNDDGTVLAMHKLKPDAVTRRVDRPGVWLIETKTAASIRTDHLVIDDQARPYGAMAERALHKAGLIKPDEKLAGILYNYLRKALPDQRPKNEKGQYLNKDGSVSKKQPPALFLRKPITMSYAAKAKTLRRIQAETIKITLLTLELRIGDVKAESLSKTQHYSCPKTCDYFEMCAAEENGTDIRQMERTLYERRNPYIYEEETTDELPTFEIG